MFDSVYSRLARWRSDGDLNLLRQGRIGLEKESLRVALSGGMALTPHPPALGSALTNPWLTTDYSEALIEFITPPMQGPTTALDYLGDLQTFVYQKLEKELLWATSMPCVLAGDDSIPVAQYGSSNAGRMKRIYRLGLGYRYGRVMQVISGVHFNWSLAAEFWPAYRQMEQATVSDDDMRNTHYMGLIRNLQRHGWMIPYLFGASPAVCKSFFLGKPTRLPMFDETTKYEPYATSLRMGDIGYQNSREEGLGIKANYDDIASYAASLAHAIKTPAVLWEELGVKVDGHYRQLNANILQIENEYYSTVRPKQVLQGLEQPNLALKRRGVQYIELRSLDVNAYHPLGVEEVQLRFLEAFMLFCLFSDSPLIGLEERLEIDTNLLMVAHRGRQPGLKLQRQGDDVPLRDWAQEITDAMAPICELLDQIEGGRDYEDALEEQLGKVHEPNVTPSARMLDEMRDTGEGFYQFARRLSSQHHRYFRERPLPEQRLQELEAVAAQSLQQQHEIEQQDEVDFDRFLQDYFQQT